MFQRIKIIMFFCFVSLLFGTTLYAQDKVYVFAAASTTNVVQELISSFQKNDQTTTEFLTSFASSSTLARQIDAGADANIYISANLKWMNWLKDKKMIEPDSDSILAKNALVVIASPANKITKLESVDQLPKLLGAGYLSMGDYNHVPAGMYGKEALESSGIWEKINKKLALYPTVRIALNAVDTDQADFGIVYKTDAMRSAKARQVYLFPTASHTPIVYPVGAIRGKNSPAAQTFLQFLKTDKAQAILQKNGFVTE